MWQCLSILIYVWLTEETHKIVCLYVFVFICLPMFIYASLCLCTCKVELPATHDKSVSAVYSLSVSITVCLSVCLSVLVWVRPLYCISVCTEWSKDAGVTRAESGQLQVTLWGTSTPASDNTTTSCWFDRTVGCFAAGELCQWLAVTASSLRMFYDRSTWIFWLLTAVALSTHDKHMTELLIFLLLFAASLLVGTGAQLLLKV